MRRGVKHKANRAARSGERKIAGVAFCWQEKAVLRVIRDSFDATNSVTTGIAVYLALTEIASDEQAETFTRRIGEIGDRAGVGYKTAAKVLDRLESLKAIAIRRNKNPHSNERTPSDYTLLGLGNHYPRLGNNRKQASLPKGIEESPEESLEESLEEGGGAKLLAVYHRLTKLFGRSGHEPIDKEELALLKSQNPAEAQIAVIEDYYNCDSIDHDRRRQRLRTLLENFPGELDKAHRHSRRKRRGKNNGAGTKRVPKNWERFLDQKYPGAKLRDYHRAASLHPEFREWDKQNEA
jgi:hypothetical protein